MENTNMPVISLDTGLRKIAINDTNGELLTVLRINISDSTLGERFAKLISNIENCASDYESKLSEKMEETKDSDDITKVVEVSRVNTSFMAKLIAEINEMFGENTIANICKENYEADPDFMPDEYIIMDFIENIIPVMENLLGERFKMNKAKYSTQRRGKQSRAKERI